MIFGYLFGLNLVFTPLREMKGLPYSSDPPSTVLPEGIYLLLIITVQNVDIIISNLPLTRKFIKNVYYSFISLSSFCDCTCNAGSPHDAIHVAAELL